MDAGDPVGPTNSEKDRFLKKIYEWRRLGFDTKELEYLLENDFNEFLRQRHKILKYQVDRQKSLVVGLAAEDLKEITDEKVEHSELPDSSQSIPPANEFEEDLDEESTIELTPGREELSGLDDDEELLLLGEPLPPEDELDTDAEEESVIFVGKFAKEKKTKVHRSREPEMKAVERAQRRKKIEHDDFDDEVSRHKRTKSRGADKERVSDDYADSDLDVDDDVLDENYDEEAFEDYDDEYDDDYDDEDDEIRERSVKERRSSSRQQPRRSRVDDEKVGAGRRIATAAVIIIIILSAFYLMSYADLPSIINEPGEKINAAFEVSPNIDPYRPGTMIGLDASMSRGEKLRYQWIMDDDFVVVNGSLRSKMLDGYFVATENEVKTKTITLKLISDDEQDTIAKEVRIQPQSFQVTEEKIGSRGQYRVNGFIDVSNPDGIIKTELEGGKGLSGELEINRVNVVFRNRGSEPLTLELREASNINDGFQQSHSVYERAIYQDLILSGKVTGSIKPDSDFGLDNKYPVSEDIDGDMVSEDFSYTDFETHNTVFGKAKNDMEIRLEVQNPILESDSYSFKFTTSDSIESYPDLQKNPMHVSLSDLDLANDGLKLGDTSSFSSSNIHYNWDADKIEYVYNRPAIRINLTIDDFTKLYFNIKEFFMDLWIAEGISQPVKTHLYSVQTFNTNTTTINYVSTMTGFSEGNIAISSQDCDASTDDGHYYKQRPEYSYTPTKDWQYLPPIGISAEREANVTSFDGFTHTAAINLALSQNIQDFKDYLDANSDCYVIKGYYTAAGESGNVPTPEGVLTWNLTFGVKGEKNAFNIIIPQQGEILTESIKLDDEVPNSTADFEPVLTFGSSEDILLNYKGKEFYTFIFDQSTGQEPMVDLLNVGYGIETNRQYPNVDIMSIMFVENSEYAYVVSYTEKTDDGGQRNIFVGLDGETGQLLYYWDHTDDGFNIF
jgi:hypothetical protein